MACQILTDSTILLAGVRSVASASLEASASAGRLGSTVDLGYAKYISSTNRLGIDEFLGMRFAAPPLGDLRFRAPQDPLPEEETIRADKHGPICLSVMEEFVPSNPSAEDCLSIDVFTPANPKKSSRLPVVLWIQGGAHNTNCDANFNGSSLINASNHNMIVVTFNYRVGPYGFLASEDVRRDGDLNVGLLDQRKAMEWTKKHISSFGGDPNHIVLMGTSSGGGSVMYQLAAFDGKHNDLFVGAIASSSSHTSYRALPGEQLQAANIARPYPGSRGVALFTYAPCIDGSFFTRPPISQIRSGKLTSVPLLIGNTEDEGTMFGLEANTTEQVSDILKIQYPELTTKSLDAINIIYPFDAARHSALHTPFFASASAAYGEGIMTCPSLNLAKSLSLRAPSAVRVWNYRYNVREPANIAAGLGVPYTWEIDAVWGPGYAVNPKGSNSYTGVDASIVPVVQTYWQSFIRTVNPNTHKANDSPLWEPFTKDNWLLIQTNTTRMEFQSRAEASRCVLWESIRNSSLHQ
ncbi:triacylglycerol lipase-like protein [Cadophora sp. MPI-SDFR-AT-0126]|nr:triacylglycerol lipase-like protein [Leotiomycetes sp. MPI-SDFR-AT-0126]